MEKRMILAIALSIAVLIGYQYYYSPALLLRGGTAGKDNAAGVPAPAAKGGPAPSLRPFPEVHGKDRRVGPNDPVKTPLYSASPPPRGR